ncbi:MAG: hypothetical protein OZ934_10160 [Anaerolineae bacterium]|nr:hypothetical protein [Anaerolineae bacterium]
MNLNRLAGVMLIVVGLVVGALAAAWLFSNEDLKGPARILGLAIALLVLVVPLVGGGVYMLAFGGQQARQEAEAARQRKLLNVVQTRGQVRLDELAVELQLPRDRIKDMVHDLVGLGVFSGYVKWDEGVLYSSDAQQLRDLQQCPNCGGAITLSGKGIATCQFCGTEFFLS